MSRTSALLLARIIADELIERGAQAVVLMGSYARGDARQSSDLDLYVIGDGPYYQLSQRSGFLISTSWRTALQIRDGMYSASECGGLVPGWRRAIILTDPDGIAASLQTAAHTWRWSNIDQDACDRWVAEEVTGYAEEVQKLIGMLDDGDHVTAAAQRSILALRLAVPLAVHFRLLYDSENHLWTKIGSLLGENWTLAQANAFGLNGASFQDSVLASLRLFRLAISTTFHLANPRQRQVLLSATEEIAMLERQRTDP